MASSFPCSAGSVQWSPQEYPIIPQASAHHFPHLRSELPLLTWRFLWYKSKRVPCVTRMNQGLPSAPFCLFRSSATRTFVVILEVHSMS